MKMTDNQKTFLLQQYENLRDKQEELAETRKEINDLRCMILALESREDQIISEYAEVLESIHKFMSDNAIAVDPFSWVAVVARASIL